MNKTGLTIALPALNSIKYINQCLDSILAQTFTEFELLCIDAGSTDGTLEVFQEYAAKDTRIRVIHSDKRSYGHQVNLALDLAQGEYFTIVESDDFIASNMYESLFRLSKNHTVDVIKSNFYDYYEYEGVKPVALPSTLRRKMPTSDTVFTVNEYPHILEGHPSIWSAIYRTAFLKDLQVRFLEVPGGGWTDNPFFFETLCAAKTICWTAKPYYYYRRNNPESSSNKITDLTLPVRRMMDNLDVIEKYNLSNESLGMIYERAMYYLNGSFEDANYPAQETQIREWAIKLYSRLDRNIVDNYMDACFREIYYNYISPLMLKRSSCGKILIYTYLPNDASQKYMTLPPEQVAQIMQLLDLRYDLDIYILAVRNSIDQELALPRFEKRYNQYSQKVFAYETVNTNVLTPDIYHRFLELLGPFDVQYFTTDEGVDFVPGINQNTVVSSYEKLKESVLQLKQQETITFTGKEWNLMMRQSDYLFRLQEENFNGGILESGSFKIYRKIYKGFMKIRGAYRCYKEHGASYTMKRYLNRIGR